MVEGDAARQQRRQPAHLLQPLVLGGHGAHPSLHRLDAPRACSGVTSRWPSALGGGLHGAPPAGDEAGEELVEGMSDQAAVQTLAERSGRDLRAEGVFVVPMGRATNIGHFVDLFGPGRFGVRLAGLCDQGEERDFRRGLDRAGPYFVCVADLKDEMIRALGAPRVEDLIEAEGERGRSDLHPTARPP